MLPWSIEMPLCSGQWSGARACNLSARLTSQRVSFYGKRLSEHECFLSDLPFIKNLSNIFRPYSLRLFERFLAWSSHQGKNRAIEDTIYASQNDDAWGLGFYLVLLSAHSDVFERGRWVMERQCRLLSQMISHTRMNCPMAAKDRGRIGDRALLIGATDDIAYNHQNYHHS